MSHFTLGYSASSPVESFFSAFKRALGDEPKSFAGIVQAHVKKDRDKHEQERRTMVNLSIISNDTELVKYRSDAANCCAKVFSHKVTEKFEVTNQQAQNYIAHKMSMLSPDQIMRGVTIAHKVTRRVAKDPSNIPPLRIVEEIDGIKYCSCCEALNSGQPDRHIQCVLGGAFVENQFHQHFKITKDIEVDEVDTPSLSQTQEITPLQARVGDVYDVELSPSDNVADMRNDMEGDVDNTPTFGSTTLSEDLPLQSQSDVRRPQFKKKKLESSEKYNGILEEARQIANIASQDTDTSYNKIINLLRYIRTNMQNEGEEELKVATADYRGFKTSEENSSCWVNENSNGDGIGDATILSPTQKRTSGSMSTSRKRSSVETAVRKKLKGSKEKRICSLCGEMGHDRSNQECPARKLGTRLTKTTWDRLHSVMKLSVPLSDVYLDPVLPSDAKQLKIDG